MVLKDFKASDARALAKREDKTPNGLTTLLKHIKESAAKDRETETTIAGDLIKGDPKDLVKELKARGFKAEYVSDFRDGDYYSISW